MIIQMGDKVKLKKPHPCGSFEWEVIRSGADYKLKCMGCNHIMMISRASLEKSIRHEKEKQVETRME